jgi:hypothetical protein
MTAARYRRCLTRGTWILPLPRLSLHPERNGRGRAPVHSQARETRPAAAKFGPKLNGERAAKRLRRSQGARNLCAVLGGYHATVSWPRARRDLYCSADGYLKAVLCLTAHRLRSCIKLPAALAFGDGARRAQAQDPEDAPRPGVGGVCALS